MDVSGQTHGLATLLPEEKPGFYLVGGWVGTGTGVVVLEKE